MDKKVVVWIAGFFVILLAFNLYTANQVTQLNKMTGITGKAISPSQNCFGKNDGTPCSYTLGLAIQDGRCFSGDCYKGTEQTKTVHVGDCNASVCGAGNFLSDCFSETGYVCIGSELKYSCNVNGIPGMCWQGTCYNGTGYTTAYHLGNANPANCESDLYYDLQHVTASYHGPQYLVAQTREFCFKPDSEIKKSTEICWNVVAGNVIQGNETAAGQVSNCNNDGLCGVGENTATCPDDCECDSNSDCGVDENCAAGKCIPQVIVKECTEDDNCTDNEICNLQTWKCINASSGCSETADCAEGGVCDSGECVAACLSDMDCGVDESCNASSGLCYIPLNNCTDTCSSENFECGMQTICGNQENCGECESGKTCNNGICEAECVPDCSGVSCGDDGCGGSCGECTTGTCNNGVCGASTGFFSGKNIYILIGLIILLLLIIFIVLMVYKNRKIRAGEKGTHYPPLPPSTPPGSPSSQQYYNQQMPTPQTQQSQESAPHLVYQQGWTLEDIKNIEEMSKKKADEAQFNPDENISKVKKSYYVD